MLQAVHHTICEQALLREARWWSFHDRHPWIEEAHDETLDDKVLARCCPIWTRLRSVHNGPDTFCKVEDDRTLAEDVRSCALRRVCKLHREWKIMCPTDYRKWSDLWLLSTMYVHRAYVYYTAMAQTISECHGHLDRHMNHRTDLSCLGMQRFTLLEVMLSHSQMINVKATLRALPSQNPEGSTSCVSQGSKTGWRLTPSTPHHSHQRLVGCRSRRSEHGFKSQHQFVDPKRAEYGRQYSQNKTGSERLLKQRSLWCSALSSAGALACRSPEGSWSAHLTEAPNQRMA